jgi:hypothetical protein
MGVDAELDRVVAFGRSQFVFSHYGCQFRGFHPRLTTPCHLAITVVTFSSFQEILLDAKRILVLDSAPQAKDEFEEFVYD